MIHITSEDTVTWQREAANNYASHHLEEGAAAVLNMSEVGDQSGQCRDTHVTAGVVTFTLTAVVLQCGSQGKPPHYYPES